MAWFLANTIRCATCHLNIHSCPGHCGHIDLPVHLFHVTFIDQLYRYIRARCVYCSRFRLARVELNRYVCKLRLLQYGLLAEAAELDDVGLRKDLDEEHLDGDDIMEKRNEFVRKSIRRAGGHKRDFDFTAAKSEAAMETRRDVLTQFQADIIKGRACKMCKGISPTYKKIGSQTFFEKVLNAKERAMNAQNHKRKPASALAENVAAKRRSSRS